MRTYSRTLEEKIYSTGQKFKSAFFELLIARIDLLAHHVVLVEVFRLSVLILLVLRDQVVHIGLRLGELHLVHAFASVPVEESLN